MNRNHNGVDTWNRFKRATRDFAASASGRRAIGLLVLLLLFLLSSNGLNVLNSYVGRDFITAIENRNLSAFTRQVWLYLSVFALSTAVAVLYRFTEERLGLLWRDWQTRRLLNSYLNHRVYYHLEEVGGIENPDQRIAEDVRTFTTATLSFGLMTLNATFTVIAFSGVLWSISPRLFVVAVAYAATGSLLAMLLGKKLIKLNDQQLDREADFRSELIHVRDNAESVALLQHEPRLRAHLLHRLSEVVTNTRRIVAVNRNLGFFTTGYNYLIQIMPALIVAPLFIQGKVEFGVVTQSAMAFAQLMGAFSLIVTQFQSISSYAAVVARLDRLMNVMDDACTCLESPIELQEQNGHLIYDKLTLRRAGGQLLIKDLSLSIERGTRVLFVGSSGHAKAALFKATAGLRCAGEGRIIRPDSHAMLFVPERPYLPKGSLREMLLAPGLDGSVTNEAMLSVLQQLGLEAVVNQAGNLDQVQDWNSLLSVNEQAHLIIARALLAAPEFIFLDRQSVAMDTPQVDTLLGQLTRHNITYLMLSKSEELVTHFDTVVTLALDGTWTRRDLKPRDSSVAADQNEIKMQGSTGV